MDACKVVMHAVNPQPIIAGDCVAKYILVKLPQVRKLASKEKRLRSAIRRSLRAQGFHVADDRISFRQKRDKRSIRKRHELAVEKRILLAEGSLARDEDKLLAYIASGNEIDPIQIKPKLVRVEPDTFESKLFRYACLHWSIPVSEGYGRRLRFLIIDESNNKLIGLFALGDPVYAIKARDEWIGWDLKTKAERLYHVMDAYVLGAVPPYSRLLGGKLVALATASNEVRRVFFKRYLDRKSLITGKKRVPHLVLVTTTSALGRSSIYNRVKYKNRLVFQSVGFTGGWGEFHFSDGVYEDLSEFAKIHCVPTEKKEKWGNGFRSRRELVQKVLYKLGFPKAMLNHGIQRELFIAPLAVNTRKFLRGEDDHVRYRRLSFAKAVEFWRTRWLLPRAERDNSFQDFKPEDWRLWKKQKSD
jgi:hypothetical protein